MSHNDIKNLRIKTAEARAVFNSYDTDFPENHPEFDPTWLEESHKSPVAKNIIGSLEEFSPGSIRDIDGDGYREIKVSAIKKAMNKGVIEFDKSLPLTPFFNDSYETIQYFIDLTKAAALSVPKLSIESLGIFIGMDFEMEYSFPIPIKKHGDRLANLPPKLKGSLKYYNFSRAAEYFRHKANSKSKDKLLEILNPLARAISATLVHSGMNYSDALSLDGPNGLSVRRGGKLRSDCGGFANLAMIFLSKIDGIEFNYVILDNGKADKIPEMIGGATLVCSLPTGCNDISKIECDKIFRFDLYQNTHIQSCRQMVPKGHRPARMPECGPSGSWEYTGELTRCHKCYPDDEAKIIYKYKSVAVTEISSDEAQNVNFRYPNDLHTFCENAFIPYEIYDNLSPNYSLPKKHANLTISFSDTSEVAMDKIDAHMILLATIGNTHIIVDNNIISYVETENIFSHVRNLYSKKYINFRKRPTFTDRNNTSNF